MAEDTGRQAENEDDDAADDDEDDGPEETVEDLRDKLKAANADAKRWRFRATGRDKDWKAPGTKTTEPPKDAKPKEGDAPDVEEIERKIREKVEAEYEAKASDGNLRAAVSVALLGAGLALSEDQLANPAKTRSAVTRVVGMMNLKNLTLEDDGEVAGLEDEINDLRSTYPGMFTKANSNRPQSRTRGSDGAQRNRETGRKNEDPVHDLAASWFNRS